MANILLLCCQNENSQCSQWLTFCYYVVKMKTPSAANDKHFVIMATFFPFISQCKFILAYRLRSHSSRLVPLWILQELSSCALEYSCVIKTGLHNIWVVCEITKQFENHKRHFNGVKTWSDLSERSLVVACRLPATEPRYEAMRGSLLNPIQSATWLQSA